jgi:outer membrane scaffolding protein for murein synthesis (MipA/OmpV family)
MKSFPAALCGLALAAALGGQAFAQGDQSSQSGQPDQSGQSDQSGGIQGTISVGAGLLPDYEGASKYIIVPYVEAQAYEGNYFLRFDGGALQLNLLDDENFHAGPLMGYRMGRGVVHYDAVSRMHHIRYSITDGAFVEYERRADDPRSGERVTLSVAEGNINYQSGLNVELRGVVHRPLTFIDEGLIAAVEGDLAWGDGSYMQTYFGIDGPDALASGFPPFHARSGMESAGVALALDQFLSRKWSVGVRFHYKRLMSDAADSPVTAIAGSPDQMFAGLVVGYVL